MEARNPRWYKGHRRSQSEVIPPEPTAVPRPPNTPRPRYLKQLSLQSVSRKWNKLTKDKPASVSYSSSEEEPDHSSTPKSAPPIIGRQTSTLSLALPKPKLRPKRKLHKAISVNEFDQFRSSSPPEAKDLRKSVLKKRTISNDSSKMDSPQPKER